MVLQGTEKGMSPGKRVARGKGLAPSVSDVASLDPDMPGGGR